MREVKENKNLLFRIRFKRSWCGNPSKRQLNKRQKCFWFRCIGRKPQAEVLFGLMNKTGVSTNGTGWLCTYKGCK